MFKYALGYTINREPEENVKFLTSVTDVKDLIHDVHFAHNDKSEISSGRSSMKVETPIIQQFIKDCRERDIRPTLLMNYLLHDDYHKIIQVFDENYYKHGVNSVVVADLELIKRLRDKYPDLYIQGSALSYRTTVEQLREEADAGVQLHNPAVEIIRDPWQIMDNAEAGFKQKIMPFEGCFRHCRHEKRHDGHRYRIARDRIFSDCAACSQNVLMDLRQFFLANWITINKLRQYAGVIDVVKLPRGSFFAASTKVEGESSGELIGNAAKMLIEGIEAGGHHDVVDLNAVLYGDVLRKFFKKIPSELFDDNFFAASDYCNMQCDKLGCYVCFDKAKALEQYLIDPKTYRISGVSLTTRKEIPKRPSFQFKRY